MSSQSRFDPKALAAHAIVALFVGAAISYFTDAKWLAASLWVSAAMFINGSIATLEDARPGGFNNPDGTEAPDNALHLRTAPVSIRVNRLRLTQRRR